MTDPRNGCPDYPEFPPENTIPSDEYDLCDEIYQIFKDGRFEDEFI